MTIARSISPYHNHIEMAQPQSLMLPILEHVLVASMVTILGPAFNTRLPYALIRFQRRSLWLNSSRAQFLLSIHHDAFPSFVSAGSSSNQHEAGNYLECRQKDMDSLVRLLTESITQACCERNTRLCSISHRLCAHRRLCFTHIGSRPFFLFRFLGSQPLVNDRVGNSHDLEPRRVESSCHFSRSSITVSSESLH